MKPKELMIIQAERLDTVNNKLNQKQSKLDTLVLKQEKNALLSIGNALATPNFMLVRQAVMDIDEIDNWPLRSEYKNTYFDALLTMGAEYAQCSKGELRERLTYAHMSAQNRKKIHATVTVLNNVQGQIRLVDEQGEYTEHFVSPGSRYIAWEQATINDELMYRIGKNDRWISSQYAAIDR